MVINMVWFNPLISLCVGGLSNDQIGCSDHGVLQSW